MAELIQWNIRGLQANREELSLLISSFNPEIIALQETNIGINHNINYQNYSLYNCHFQMFSLYSGNVCGECLRGMFRYEHSANVELNVCRILLKHPQFSNVHQMYNKHQQTNKYSRG